MKTQTLSKQSLWAALCNLDPGMGCGVRVMVGDKVWPATLGEAARKGAGPSLRRSPKPLPRATACRVTV